MADTTQPPDNWVKRHSTLAAWAGVVSCIVGIALMCLAWTIATADQDSHWARCTTVTQHSGTHDVTTRHPSPHQPGGRHLGRSRRSEHHSRHSRVTTCDAPGITGIAALPGAAGLLLALPLVRLLVSDLEISLGVLSIKKSQLETPRGIEKVLSTATADWDLAAVIAAQRALVDSEVVQPSDEGTDGLGQ